MLKRDNIRDAVLKRRGVAAEGSPWDTIEALNHAWRTGRADEIDDLFHPDAVILHPDLEGRTEGRDACVQTYIDFALQATVSRLEVFEPQVDVFADTAVVSYGFEIDYEMHGNATQNSGTELTVLMQHEGRWQLAWRTLVMDG